MDFLFDDETHTYTLGGEVLPSITQVLPYEMYDFLPDCRERGKAVHKMVYLANIGKNDIEIMVEPGLISWFQNDNFENYLKAYRDFRSKHELAGIYEVKATGSPHPATPLQLAAQSMLAKEGLPNIAKPCFEQPMYHSQYKFAGTPDIIAGLSRVYAVYLKDNGKFKLEDHTKDLRRNTQIFLSFLTCHKWRKEKGL